MKPWMCSKCQKRFNDPTPIRMHIRDVHDGDGKPVRVPKSERRQREDAEPSIAQRAIDAQQNRAMGLPVDDEFDWINDL